MTARDGHDERPLGPASAEDDDESYLDREGCASDDPNPEDADPDGTGLDFDEDAAADVADADAGERSSGLLAGAADAPASASEIASAGEAGELTLDPTLSHLGSLAEDDEAASLLTDRELDQRDALESTDWSDEADRVFDELMERVGEAQPQPRLNATRRAVELLGDVHRAYPIVHITGTNGKTSTARLSERLLRAHGLRTGLLTSPHLERFAERIAIDGEPVSDERLVANWDDIKPFLELVDRELEDAGEPRLTFFEAATVLGFACFADAPVDVAVLEVGMGGEWDSTNVADGDVAVFAPIALDHAGRLGSTIEEIARTKAGIIKDGAHVVSAPQREDAERVLRERATEKGASFRISPVDFDVTSNELAVGGRLISVRGTAGVYDDLLLPLTGEHQGRNAALAIAAVEAFFGGDRPLERDLVEEALGDVRVPGRLEPIGAEPTVIVDAAHNPHGAHALAEAVAASYAFDELTVVLGVLHDKDAEGIVRELAPVATRFIVTASESDRAEPAEELAELVRELTGRDCEVYEYLEDALDRARSIAAERNLAVAAESGAPESEAGALSAAGGSAVLVSGSITLIGQAKAIARREGWLVEAGRDAAAAATAVVATPGAPRAGSGFGSAARLGAPAGGGDLDDDYREEDYADEQDAWAGDSGGGYVADYEAERDADPEDELLGAAWTRAARAAFGEDVREREADAREVEAEFDGTPLSDDDEARERRDQERGGR